MQQNHRCHPFYSTQNLTPTLNHNTTSFMCYPCSGSQWSLELIWGAGYRGLAVQLLSNSRPWDFQAFSKLSSATASSDITWGTFCTALSLHKRLYTTIFFTVYSNIPQDLYTDFDVYVTAANNVTWPEWSASSTCASSRRKRPLNMGTVGASLVLL